MIIVKGGVATPKGFTANGMKSGIKLSGKRDLALIFSDVPAAGAGAFTTNRCQAAPVKVSIANLKFYEHQAIIVNSGNANCANGPTGESDALKMTMAVSELFGIDRRAVLVASTGIIGQKLPVEKIVKAAPELIAGLSPDNSSLFAETIMTTDTVKKEIAVKIKIGTEVVTLGGACKGVGMIYPEMSVCNHATMLAFITTDASISKNMLREALSEAVKDSFNMISVDGDMSTNDSCFVLANGMAGNRKISAKDADYIKFMNALNFVCNEMSGMLVRDGEGATKFIRIVVKGASKKNDARIIARKVSTSNLLKCAIFGEDPNWGRVVASAGSAGVAFDIARTDIYLGSIKALSNGSIAPNFNKEKARKFFKAKEITITVDLKSGKHSAEALTCDFSKEYVSINSEYST